MSVDEQMRQAQLDKLTAEVGKLIEETRKTRAEASWYPLTVIITIMGATAAIIGATAALVKLFFT